ncbi:MAG: type II toxin-antitoxin system RelE/ParE family toxin [Gemmatimonadaceae bacterium]|nr:type II toxin-antitoxin system RelE/ParE family toxin [Gemmatimonadaceae bacterium]
MRSLRWTERAVAHLEGIVEFIGVTSPVYAESVVLRIEQRLQLACEHPGIGKPAPEAPDESTRELVVMPYRVFYREHAGAIEVLAIVHGRQHLPDAL